MESPRYRLYKNRAEPGDCIFATTTVLDFAPIFKSQRLANLATTEIVSYAIETQVRLHAFVLMHHHLHLVVRLNEQMSGSMWMQQLKSRTAYCIGKNLTERQRGYLSEQIGLNNRSFWKRSFRSVRIETEKVFWQKVRYTHLNPVRAGYSECESEYAWSSKRFWDEGLWNEEVGLDKAKFLIAYKSKLSESSLNNSFLAVEA